MRYQLKFGTLAINGDVEVRVRITSFVCLHTNIILKLGMTIGRVCVGYYSPHPYTCGLKKKKKLYTSPYPHGNTLCPRPIPYGYSSIHTRTHYPHSAKNKLINYKISYNFNIIKKFKDFNFDS
jgi:hypothetical protein